MECQTLEVGELFSGARLYQMPIFQRPFAWTEDEAGQLLDDIMVALNTSEYDTVDESYYFLGQLIVSQVNPGAPFEVVDGQQRLVTLSALLAVLRDRLPNDSRSQKDLQKYIVRPVHTVRNLSRHPRITVRDTEQHDYQAWISDIGGTLDAPDQAGWEPSDRLARVVSQLRNDIGHPHEAYISGLVDYILNRCYVVLVIASNAMDGYQLFRSINARGQPLSDLDIVRGEIINKYQSPKLSQAWNEIEDKLGVDQLENYVRSIMALIHPETQNQPFRLAMRTLLSHPAKSDLFTDTLKKFVEIYDKLEQCDIVDGDEVLNRVVSCVKALPFDEWVPAALLWLAQNPHHKETLDFFRALDALGLGLLIMGSRKPTIVKRMRQVVERVISQDCVSDPKSPIYLTAEERKKIKATLNGPIKGNARFIRPLLLRLNIELLDESIPPYFPEQITLEHILPQKPNPRSMWKKNFPNANKRNALCHMLGNMALLSGRANSRASNFDFQTKREKMFGGPDSNVFPLTAQLVKYPDWTPESIMERHDEMLELTRTVLKL